MGHKNYKRRNILLILLFTPVFAFSQIWPSTDIKVDLNFGAKEGTIFHDGIDISGTAGTTKVKAVYTFKIVDGQSLNGSYDIVGKIEDVTAGVKNGSYIGYGHISPLSNITFYNGKQIDKDSDFATVAPHINAGVYLDHLHFGYASIATIGDELQTVKSNSLNPLKELFSGAVQDPGSNKPKLGPLFIRETSSYPNNYITNLGTNKYLYGELVIIREITDNMGDIPSASSTINPDQNAYYDASIPNYNIRYDGITSVPYKIIFSIKNETGNIVFPITGVSNVVEFNNSPSNYTLGKIYSDIASNMAAPFNTFYCFLLTSMSNTGQLTWNTSEFPDGTYKLCTTAEDLKYKTGDASFPPASDIIQVNVDNFLPYVDKVVVKSGTTEIYNSDAYDFNSDVLQLDFKSPNPNAAADVQNLTEVQVTFSEAMSAVQIQPSYGSVTASSSISSDKKTWSCVIAGLADALSHTEEIDLNINAQDLSGNNLISGNNITESILPIKRNSTGAYSEVEVATVARHDDMHKFKISSCPVGQKSGNCLFAAFSYTPLNPIVGSPVNFTDHTIGTPSSWTWTFEGGTPPYSLDQSPIGIIFSTQGSHLVTLMVDDYYSNDNTHQSIEVRQSETAPIAEFSAQPTLINIGESVEFSDFSDNDPTQWNWSFPGGIPSFSYMKYPTINYSSAGTYDVTLTVTNNDGSSTKTKMKYIVVKDPNAPVNISCSTNTNMPSVGETVNFEGILTSDFNIQHNYTYSFNFGDNFDGPHNLYWSYQFTQHTYDHVPDGGNYTPSFTVNEYNNGILLNTYTTGCGQIQIFGALHVTINGADAILNNSSDNDSYTATVTQGTAPVSFYWNVYDESGNPMFTPDGYSTTFESSGSNTTSDLFFSFLNNEYITPGNYYVRVTAYDAFGNTGVKNMLVVVYDLLPDPGCIVSEIHLIEPYSSPDKHHIWVNRGSVVGFYNGSWINTSNNCDAYSGEHVNAVVWTMSVAAAVPGEPNSYYNQDNIFQEMCVKNGINGNDFYCKNFFFPDVGDFFIELNAKYNSTTSGLLSMYKINQLVIHVEDCGSDRIIFDSPLIGNAPYVSGESITESGLNIHSWNTSVGSGSHVNFLGGNEVILDDEFVADYGSDFVASISSCRVNYTSQCPSSVQVVYKKSEDHLNEKLNNYFIVYPNPFSNSFEIDYNILENNSEIQLQLYNSIGEQISLIETGIKNTGKYNRIFDGSSLPSGLYFCVLKVNNKLMTNKILKTN